MAQPLIEITGLYKAFGSFKALEDVSLEIDKGKVLTLLGPSGCGKSTTLRIVAGLETPDEGRITIGGTTILSTTERINLPPERRNMGLVFQSYAIWPHMTVAENVAYPLKLRRLPSAEIKRRVGEALKLVDLHAFADRDAPKLSGGQQQRVALARALVYEPQVLLLDEPLSNLDVKLREQMRFELKLLQTRLNLTLIYVTHDQTEALSLSDQIAVMNRGRIEQLGAPRELYERPTTEFVRDFLGKTITFPVEVRAVDGDRAAVFVTGQHGELKCRLHGRSTGASTNNHLTLAVRPERVQIRDAGQSQENCLVGKLETVLYQGERTECVVRVGDSLMTIYAPADTSDFGGGEVLLHFPEEAISLWPR